MANLCPRCLYIYIVEFAVLYHRSASFCVLCRPYSCFITGVVALLFYAGCRGLDALPDNTAHAADAHHVRLSEYHFLILPWHNFFWSSKGDLVVYTAIHGRKPGTLHSMHESLLARRRASDTFFPRLLIGRWVSTCCLENN